MTEEETNKNVTPDEARCCDIAAEQAPVTKEELRKAIDHVMDLVRRYDGHVAVAVIMEDEEKINRIFNASDAVFVSEGANTKVYAWTGACGYLLRANECFDHNVKAIGEGVRLFLEAQLKEKMKNRMNPIAAMLGIAGCECEECEED